MRRYFLPIIATSFGAFKKQQEATPYKEPRHFCSSLKPCYHKNPAEKFGIYVLNPFWYHRLEFFNHPKNSPILLYGTNTISQI